MSNYRTELNNYLKGQLIDAASVLSIGCERDDRAVFKGVRAGEWLTLDVDERFKPDFLFDLNKPLLDDDGELVLPELLERFEVIVMLNVWEYIYNPMEAHRNLFLMLKAGGYLLTNYPFVYPQHLPAGTDFLRYTPAGAKRLLMANGFSVVDEVPMWAGTDAGGLLIDAYAAGGMKAAAGFWHDVIGLIIKAKK